jgi:hypothetical protein
VSFTPIRVPISNITQANPAVVTTSTNHNLTTGQVVRINVPKNYGMVELNHQALLITILSSVTFSLQYSQIPPALNVNSTNFTAFTTPSNPQFTAEVLPIGSGPTPINSPISNALRGTCDDLLDDATTNISTVEIPF